MSQPLAYEPLRAEVGLARLMLISVVAEKFDVLIKVVQNSEHLHLFSA
jgi:hypothetical protein